MAARTSALVAAHSLELSEPARAVHAALRSFGRELLAVDDPVLDLPLRQFKVCVALSHGGRSMSDVARELRLSRSAVTQVSDRLERRGLVERSFENEDRRVRKLKLTTKGQRLMRSHEEKQLTRIDSVIGRLPETELKQMLQGLQILVRCCGTHNGKDG